MKTIRLSLRLSRKAHEMAQEEIAKQATFLSRGLTGLRFTEDGSSIEFDAPEDEAKDLLEALGQLADRISAGLRTLKRKIVYRTKNTEVRSHVFPEGLHAESDGIVALEGLPLAVFEHFDESVKSVGRRWHSRALLTPTLIPTTDLARCDYLRSFPHNLTFACHLPEDFNRVDDFRRSHLDRDTVDSAAMRDMVSPEACLSPAVCYHVYALQRGRTIPAGGLAYNVKGKCFRYESKNMRDLRRLWDFTMREVVFLGTRDEVFARRDEALSEMSAFLEAHGVAGEIRTASDPFFVAPESVGKAYFQISAETKLEVALPLGHDDFLAVGSLNYHGDFFGKAFNVLDASGGPMHSACLAFGLERWVWAFLTQLGSDSARWPEAVRRSVERRLA